MFDSDRNKHYNSCHLKIIWQIAKKILSEEEEEEDSKRDDSKGKQEKGGHKGNEDDQENKNNFQTSYSHSMSSPQNCFVPSPVL